MKRVFEDKDWSEGGKHPRSGVGSSLALTARIREALPGLFDRYEVQSFVDAPCGDWSWMQEVDLQGVDYVGLDISESLIAANQAAYARDGVSFAVADVTSDPLPKADLFMCRDCLFHLKYWLRWEFFQRFVASGSRYLLTTMHAVEANRNVRDNGRFQAFNPTKSPFDFPEPVEAVVETATRNDAGDLVPVDAPGGERWMAIWSLEQVRKVVARFNMETAAAG
ncbi:MAG: methyltransferase domain-containing protein [Boseongicola sp.]|nr:MAG: methyltransferase domain-containing protein [Boseongicola sp.]